MAEGTLRETHSQAYVEWSIDEMCISLSILKKKDYVESPSFSLSDAKWNIRIYPKSKSKDGTYGSLIGLYLLETNIERDYEVQYTMGVKDAKGSVFMSTDLKSTFNKTNVGNGKVTLFMKSTLLTSPHVKADNSLTFFCSALVLNNKESATQISSDAATILSESFKDLYGSRRFTDATIVVQGREFSAHKNVLSMRSAVFSAMFETNMTEKSSGRVEISDCDPDSFADFLLFMYTGKLDIVSSSNAMHLYKTADKYDMTELREKCVFCMSSELTVDSIFDVFHLATVHNDPDLHETATDFFVSNAETIVKSIKWKHFLAENFSLGNELILKLAESKNKE